MSHAVKRTSLNGIINNYNPLTPSDQNIIAEHGNTNVVAIGRLRLSLADFVSKVSTIPNSQAVHCTSEIERRIKFRWNIDAEYDTCWLWRQFSSDYNFKKLHITTIRYNIDERHVNR